ncbi:MAG: caspase family protein [Bacteroidota bacterium]
MYNPLTIRSAEADVRPFAKENAYAILVGVGSRPDDVGPMQVTATDADTVRKALVKAFDLFDEKNVATLTDGAASTKNIIDELDKLAAITKNKAADFVIIYFSGHGYTRDGQYFLITNDAIKPKNEDAGLEITELAKKMNAIAGSGFSKKLTDIQCNKMLVLLDCCHSGGIAKDAGTIPVDKESFRNFPNRMILTACAKGQVSYLSNPVSIFTYALIEALGGKFLNGTDNTVTIFSLAMDVRARVAQLSKLVLDEIATPQTPEMDVLYDTQTSNFPIAKYPKGGPQEIRLLKEEIQAITTQDGKKAIDIEGLEKPAWDEDYRKDFLWLEQGIFQTASINTTGNNNTTVVNQQAFQADKVEIHNYGPGSHVLPGGEYDKIEKLKGRILEILATWKDTFSDDEEKMLEEDINNCNNQIDELMKIKVQIR